MKSDIFRKTDFEAIMLREINQTEKQILQIYGESHKLLPYSERSRDQLDGEREQGHG